MLAVTMAAVLATSAPNPTWLGVRIGESMKQVRADLGDPVDTAQNAAYLAVVERRGFVVTISLQATSADPHIPADPHGVKIGATDAQVVALRGKSAMVDNSEGVHRLLYFGKAMWSYIFRNGSSAIPPEHGGTSFADAIVIKGEDAKTLPGWENTYISLNPCAGASKRRVVKRESISNVEGTAFDMITTT